MSRLLRGPFGRLGEALPEARYEVVQALLRASLCVTGAMTLLTVSTSSSLVGPMVVNLVIGGLSLIAAVLLARVTTVEAARRYGRWSTVADVLAALGYSLAFHDRPGAGGIYIIFVLLVGPLRYGLKGIPATVLPVALISIAWPQADQFGGHVATNEVLPLCIAFAVPAIAVRAVLMRGSGRLRQAEQMLLHQAAHDPLTDLPNRHRALTVLESALAEGEDVAVLFLDLDRFKVVNDGMGHAEGDLLLVQVAARLRDVMRSGDLVARLGGDEFVVLCRNADPRIAHAVAARALSALTAPMTTSGGLELVIGASIGIALGSTGDVGDQLLADADTAMYAAKAAGGGRARMFTSDLREAMVRNHELEVDLRAAVRSNGLHLLYQPMYDLATGVVTGCAGATRAGASSVPTSSSASPSRAT